MPESSDSIDNARTLDDLLHAFIAPRHTAKAGIQKGREAPVSLLRLCVRRLERGSYHPAHNKNPLPRLALERVPCVWSRHQWLRLRDPH